MTSSTPSRPGLPGRLRWLMAAVVVAVAALVIWQLAQGSDDDPGDAGSDPAATGSPGPGSTGEPIGPVESLAVLTLAEAGRSVTFHAAYEITDGEGATDGLGFSAVGLWRDGGWTRQDTVTPGPDGTTRTQAVRTPDGVVTLCAMSIDRIWGCTEQQADADNDLFLTAAGQLAAVDTNATDVTIDGHEGTCFSAVEDESIELCYRSDGVPLRLATASGEVLAVTSIDDDVDDSVFTTPEDGSTEPAEG